MVQFTVNFPDKRQFSIVWGKIPGVRSSSSGFQQWRDQLMIQANYFTELKHCILVNESGVQMVHSVRKRYEQVLSETKQLRTDLLPNSTTKEMEGKLLVDYFDPVVQNTTQFHRKPASHLPQTLLTQENQQMDVNFTSAVRYSRMAAL